MENGILKKAGEKIKKARKRMGITQKALSQKIGYGQSTISYWEKGSVAPSIIAIKKIEKLLGIKI